MFDNDFDDDFDDDVRRTFQAWRAQPLLPLSVLALSLLWMLPVLLVRSGVGALLVLFLLLPGVLLAVGFLGAQRVWYVRAWEGDGLSPHEAWRLTTDFVGPYFALGLSVWCLGLAVYFPLAAAIGPLPARIAITFGVDVLLTFATSAIAIDRLRPVAAVAQSWRMLRTQFHRCAPHALLPPLVLYAVASPTLFVVAEMLALVARGVTTSYYVRSTEPAPPGVRRGYLPRELL